MVNQVRKFRIENDVFGLFPKLQIAVMVFKNIDNTDKGRESFLKGAYDSFYEKIRDTDTLHPYIEDYSQAMKMIKRKKGSLASIEAMAKRIKKGEPMNSVNPVVDLYNSVSLNYLITCGGEDLDQIKGDMVLDFANGDEDFIPLGSSENSPPREGELIYRDDMGAVVRSWLWREADRTKITHQSSNILIYMELVNENRANEFENAINELYQLILDELGGIGTMSILTKESPECAI